MSKIKPILGVLGGMGPKATVYFLDLLFKKSPAKSDQEHIHTIVDFNTSIPDRSAAIINNDYTGVNKAIRQSVKRLKQAHVDFFVAPCNTVHYFLEALSSEPDLHFFNIIEETGKLIHSTGIKKVGLLATPGTVKSCLYQDYFQKMGIEIIEPSLEEQDILQHIIFDIVKKGVCPSEGKDYLETLITSYKRQGAQKIILGCTDLPIISELITNDILVDPLVILAEVCVKYAYSKKL